MRLLIAVTSGSRSLVSSNVERLLERLGPDPAPPERALEEHVTLRSATLEARAACRDDDDDDDEADDDLAAAPEAPPESAVQWLPVRVERAADPFVAFRRAIAAGLRECASHIVLLRAPLTICDDFRGAIVRVARAFDGFDAFPIVDLIAWHHGARRAHDETGVRWYTSPASRTNALMFSAPVASSFLRFVDEQPTETRLDMVELIEAFASRSGRRIWHPIPSMAYAPGLAGLACEPRMSEYAWSVDDPESVRHFE